MVTGNSSSSPNKTYNQIEDIIRDGVSDGVSDGSLLFERTIIAKDGRRIPVEINCKILNCQDQTKMLPIVRDVTERKTAEESLRISNERLRLALDAGRMGAWEVDSSTGIGNIDEVNAKLLGLPVETSKITAEEFFSRIHPEDRHIISRCAEAAAKRGSGNYDSEYRIILPDGTIRWIASKGQIIQERDGMPLRFVGVNYDISDRKLLEEELYRAKNGLAARVEEKTAELQEANKALGKSRDYLDKIINSIGDPIFVKDRQHRLVLVNDAACRLFGRSREALVGHTAYDLFSIKDMADISWLKDEEVFKRGVENVNEEVNTYVPGSTRTVLVKKTPYSDDAGNPFLVGITRDITDWKKAQEQIRFQASLLDQVHSTVIATDLNGDIIYWNKFAETLLQWTSKEILGKNIADTIVPEGKIDRMRGVISGLKANNINCNGEFNLRKKDGSVVPAYQNFNVIMDNQGEIIGLIGVATDITERKQAEESLMASEEKYRLVVENATEAIVVAQDGLLKFVNPRAVEITGYTKEELLSRPFVDFIHPDDRDLVFRSHFRRIDNSVDQREPNPPPLYKFRIVTKEGEIKWVEINIVVIEWEGTPATLNFFNDITDRILAEEALRKSEKAMRAAKESAEEATRVKSEFLANMSHEIRTPMNAVIGMTSILLDSDLDPDQRECIETIRDSGDALLSIINDVLDFSKIESGKVMPEKQPFDFRSCVEGSIDLVSVDASKKGLDLGFVIEDSVPAIVLGDPTRLRQVLLNLLGNAVKFTEEGEVMLSITSKATRNCSHEIHFAVRDTGIGIPKNGMDRLFQSFSQADMSTTRRYGGTGLGLAISKRLVEAMGGKIWAESQPIRGSTFHFTLPFEECSVNLPNPEESTSKLQCNIDANANMRILLAEDNDINRMVLVKILKKLGYRADTASNGIEAVKALERQHYDLVLMDIQMPEMDGFEATKEIRKRWPNGPIVVALTAYALEGDREKCLEAGMDGYLAKPVQKGELAEVLKKYSM
jgi:PAS domain S-box-containing protein